MRRRAAPLALALLIALPMAPVSAANPARPDLPAPVPTEVPAMDPAPAEDPAPSFDPAPSPEPAPSFDPAPAEDAVPTAEDLAPAEDPALPAPDLDAAGRWIVVLEPGTDVGAAKAKAARRLGVNADRTFRNAVPGYSARLTRAQVAALRADPSGADVVPDEVVTLQAQSTPYGVRRVFGHKSPIARIDGIDTRVDADVAIVDTGIDPAHPDLNVVGGVNCSSSDRTAWKDQNGHGTHVAGTVAAIDNGFGVVGVAPGARLWAVRILDKSGWGLLSWYVCGLDWITAQRDPADSSRPLFEAVNMSVAKSGSDDGDCGYTNSDVLHKAICRLVGSGVTVVAAAGNNSFNARRLIPASYNEVITVSALADTDGKPGGLGGRLCYSWGSYDRDDTFANFSNYGGDVDLIAPGKCIWSTKPGNTYGYSSGTSMATPHVTGAVALYKASRPLATPYEVKLALQTLGNLGWKTASDPDTRHEKLLDVRKIVPLGDFALDADSPPGVVPEAGATLQVPVTVIRSENFIEEVDLSLKVPRPLAGSLSATSLFGLTASQVTLTVTVPKGTPTGSYTVVVEGSNWNRTRSTSITVRVEGDLPSVAAPRLGAVVGSTLGSSSFTASGRWNAATDATSAIAGYQAQWSVDGGAWGSTISLGPSARSISRTFALGHRYALRIRAKDSAGNWSPWMTGGPFSASVVQDTSTALVRKGTWTRYRSSSMSGGTSLYAKASGASLSYTFTGRGVALVMPKGPTRGKAQIYVDGALAKTVDLHRRTTKARRIVYSPTWSTSATHTVKIVVVGTAGHPRVDLDAIVVIR